MVRIAESDLPHQVWNNLVSLALQRAPAITYSDLSKIIKLHHRPLKYVLEPIQNYCKDNGLPPLTILVESKGGQVGVGFTEWPLNDINVGREQVYAFDWTQITNPFPNPLLEVTSLGVQGILNIITQEWPAYRENVKVSKKYRVYDAVEKLLPQLLNSYLESDGRLKGIDTECLENQGSTGQGNISLSPWVATLDHRITRSATSGIYPVYLFTKDMQKLYLSIGLGTSQYIEAYGTGSDMLLRFKNSVETLRHTFQDSPLKPQAASGVDIALGVSRADKPHYFYEMGSIFVLPPYDTNHIDPDQFRNDYLDMVLFYQSMVTDPLMPSIDALILHESPKPHVSTDYNRLPAAQLPKGDKKNRYSEESREVGKAGELYVLECEKQKLIDNGRPDLAKRIRAHCHINELVGWDITSYDENGEELYIEVKSTRGSALDGFIISENEWKKCQEQSARYVIYRVVHVMSKAPKITVIHDLANGVEAGNLTLKPLSYQVHGNVNVV